MSTKNTEKAKIVKLNNYEMKTPAEVLRCSKGNDENTFSVVIAAEDCLMKALCSLELEKITQPVATIEDNGETTRYAILQYYFDINIDNLKEAEEIIVCKMQAI